MPAATQRPSRPASDEYHPYYAGYVAEVPAGDVLAVLERQLDETARLLRRVPPERETFRYALGKWSIREVVGHLADVERVLSHRALRFARNDPTPLPGFDENTYVPAGAFDRRPLPELLEELAAVRRATLALFRPFDAAAWARAGDANGSRVTVRALAYIIAGHERHHVGVLRERYGVGNS